MHTKISVVSSNQN